MRPPRVSVVIPTRGRPDLVGGAIASVASQTMTDLEIVVVVDGPDAPTEAVLAAIAEPRMRVEVLPEPRGAPVARNRGVAVARGEFVAILDDDDLWLPGKLAAQLAAIDRSGVEEPLGCCSRLVRLPDGRDLAWRDRSPRPGEHASEYLFVRRSLRLGESTVSSSTILARRALFLAVPFDPTVHRFEDADWVLRATDAGARLVHTTERLSIWRAPVDGASITGRNATDWRGALGWIRARRHLVSRRAYAAFLLVRVAAMADRAGDREAIRVLWREAWRVGRPGVLDVALFAGRWLVPDRLRVALRGRLAGVAVDAAEAG
jgi:glycosyltransferase involved in cell wall biosynthesis